MAVVGSGELVKQTVEISSICKDKQSCTVGNLERGTVTNQKWDRSCKGKSRCIFIMAFDTSGPN